MGFGQKIRCCLTLYIDFSTIIAPEEALSLNKNSTRSATRVNMVPVYLDWFSIECRKTGALLRKITTA